MGNSPTEKTTTSLPCILVISTVGTMEGELFCLIWLIQFCIVSCPVLTPVASPLSLTPTNTIPPVVLAKATRVSITSLPKEVLNSVVSFSPEASDFFIDSMFTIVNWGYLWLRNQKLDLTLTRIAVVLIVLFFVVGSICLFIFPFVEP